MKNFVFLHNQYDILIMHCLGAFRRNHIIKLASKSYV